MLTATSELAIKALIYLCICQKDSEAGPRPMPPTEIAGEIGASPTYLAKTLNLLVRAGILRSQRGALGGVLLAKPAKDISLLDIVQACQGLILSDYCDALGNRSAPDVCAFHQAMFEIHDKTIKAFAEWNLERLAARPAPTGKLADNTQCKMFSLGSCDCGGTDKAGK